MLNKFDFNKTYDTLFGGTELVADGHKIFKVGTTRGENLLVPYYLQGNPNQSDFSCPSINGKIITVQVNQIHKELIIIDIFIKEILINQHHFNLI